MFSGVLISATVFLTAVVVAMLDGVGGFRENVLVFP